MSRQSRRTACERVAWGRRRLVFECLERRTLLAVLTVAPGTSVQAMIDRAEPGDLVRIAAGQFVENLLITKSLVLEGAGPDATTLDGNDADSVVRVSGNIEVRIRDVGITHGHGSSSLGGGITAANAHVEIFNTEIFGNTAYLVGGGILVSGGSAKIYGNRIHDNSAGQVGGGVFICNGANAWIVNNDIEQNGVWLHSGGVGATQYSGYGYTFFPPQDIILENNLISGNTADHGPVSIASEGTVRVSGNQVVANVSRNSWCAISAVSPVQTTVADNVIEGNSGGWYNTGICSSSAGTHTIINNRISGNTGQETFTGISAAADGTLGGTFLIANNVITDNANSVLYDGNSAGILVSGPGQFDIVNNTIAGNALVAPTHAGSAGIVVAATGQTEICNNLVAFNGYDGIRGPAETLCDYNLVYLNRNAYVGGVTAGAGSLALDPKFNDRFNDDYTLASDSPARNAGDPDPAYNDADGTQNDLGYTGGPARATAPPPPEIAVVDSTGQVIADGSAVDLGLAWQGKSAPGQTLLVTNVGRSTLTLGTLSLPTGFRVSGTLPPSLEPGKSAAFAVQLDTGTIGPLTGSMTLVTNDPDRNPFDLTLTGQVIEDGVLPAALRAKLADWARNTVAYFASPQSNNKLAGLTHSWFGSGTWRELVGGTWQIKPDLKRGYGSYVVVNEITLGFNALAVAFREGWLTYADTWPQILQGLTTLRGLQTSANPDKYVDGTFHRTYLTTKLDAQSNDVDLAPDEIVQDGQNLQSSDDNALSYLNLLVLRGLATDPQGPVPETERDAAAALIDQILAAINLRRFYQNGQIVFEFRDGTPSADGWNRLSAEGAPILAAMLLSGQISLGEFSTLENTLLNYPTVWPWAQRGNLPIEYPGFHAAMFMEGLRAIHGLPVTSSEASGADFFARSTKPTTEAQVDFAKSNRVTTLGSQVMSQTFNGVSLAMERTDPNVHARFAGNEYNQLPDPATTMSLATGPHADVVPLSRFGELDPNDVVQIVDWLSGYESEFFHSVTDITFGWEAAIPWTVDDTQYAWTYNGQTFYTDNGRPYEALNSAYIVLSIFDALHPDTPLSSFSAERQRLGDIVAFFDQGTALDPTLFTGLVEQATGSGTQVGESGVTDSYSLCLRNRPDADVTLTLTANSQIRVGLSPTDLRDTVTLTITPDQWRTSQIVHVAAVDDDIAEGDHAGSISYTINSSDANYDQRNAGPTTVQILDNDVPPHLIVTSLTPAPSGCVAQFSAEFKLEGLNVYDGAGGTLGPADVIFKDSANQIVAGSIVVDSSLRSLTFVKTGGVLPADTYTVTLKSGATAFRDADGTPLDGNRDGMTGDDFTASFTVAASSGRVVSIPDIARGAGQSVNIPNADTGLPIRIDNAGGVTSLAVDLMYDPNLLNITAATLAADLPGDWSVALDTATPGVAKITASGTTALAGTNVDVVRLTAAVPNAAPYGAAQAIRLENVALNNGVIAAVGDAAIHKAVYLGDADGSGIHSSADAFLTVQAALGLASGFAAHAWTDPRIVGDADGSGVLSAADAFLIVQEGLGLVEPFVPDNPRIGVTPVGGGVDPQFRIDANLPAGVSGQVTIPVKLDIEAAATNVGAIDFDLFFDPSQLTIQLPEGMLAGADTAGWAVSAILIAPGKLRVGMVSSNGQPLAVGLREIARLQFRVEGGESRRTGWQPVRDGLPTRPPLLPPITAVWDGWETHPTLLDIEPVDSHAGGYAWTAVDGSLAIVEGEPRATLGEEPAAGALQDQIFEDEQTEFSPLEAVLADLADDLGSARAPGHFAGT